MLASFIWEKIISTDSFLIPTFCRPYLSVKTSEKLTYLTESYIPRWLRDKESVCHCRRLRFDPWVKESPLEEEMATHSSLENPMDKGAWRAKVHGITKRHYWATEYTHTHTHTHTHAQNLTMILIHVLQKEMAIHAQQSFGEIIIFLILKMLAIGEFF